MDTVKKISRNTMRCSKPPTLHPPKLRLKVRLIIYITQQTLVSYIKISESHHLPDTTGDEVDMVDDLVNTLDVKTSSAEVIMDLQGKTHITRLNLIAPVFNFLCIYLSKEIVPKTAVHRSKRKARQDESKHNLLLDNCFRRFDDIELMPLL